MSAALALVTLLSTNAGLELRWEAPGECPQREEVASAVERWLGHSLADERALSVRGRVTRVDGEFLLRLDIDGEGGHREVPGPSCAELGEAAALILAQLLDPLFMRALVAREVRDAGPPPPPAVVDAGAGPEAGAQPGVELSLAGAGDWGALPSVAPGWRLALRFSWRAVRVEAFGGTFAGQVLTNALVSLDFDAGLRGCWAVLRSPVEPLACVSLSLGRLTGLGVGVNAPETGHSLYAAAFLGAGVQVPIRAPIALAALFEAGVPLVRTAFFLENGPTVFQTRGFLMRGELAVRVRIW